MGAGGGSDRHVPFGATPLCLLICAVKERANLCGVSQLCGIKLSVILERSEWIYAFAFKYIDSSLPPVAQNDGPNLFQSLTGCDTAADSSLVEKPASGFSRWPYLVRERPHFHRGKDSNTSWNGTLEREKLGLNKE